MSVICTTINAGLNASPGKIAQAVNLFLAGVNPISINSLDKAFVGRTGEQVDIKLCYNSGGAQYIAMIFQGDSIQSADQKTNVFFTGNPVFRAPYILDISNPYLRNLLKDVCLVFSIADFSIDVNLNRYMAIVEPTAPVLAGALGTFSVIGSTGPLGAFVTATNQGTVLWGPGEYGHTAVDPSDGSWDAWPSCCPP